jgi:hypothetical protein
MGGEHLLWSKPGEWRLPGEQFVAHRTEGIDVRPMIDMGIGGCLLGRHIRRRAERHSHRGQALASGCLAHSLCDAEVHHQGVAAREHHVVGLMSRCTTPGRERRRAHRPRRAAAG